MASLILRPGFSKLLEAFGVDEDDGESDDASEARTMSLLRSSEFILRMSDLEETWKETFAENP